MTARDTAAADPFDTASVRRATIAAWTATAARFREDAAAEDELVRGGYRGRAGYELAQNAADAASSDRPVSNARPVSSARPTSKAAAERVGSIRFELTTEDGVEVLYAANTGTPLDAAGVAGLASLRASGKRSHASVGRFGLGFTGVLELTTTPSLHTVAGSVRFGPADTLAVIRGDGALQSVLSEVDRRAGTADPAGAVPILRLPFPAERTERAAELLDRGFATIVRLPLDRPGAPAAARDQLGRLGDPTLLALGALGELTIEDAGRERRYTDVASRWHVIRASGVFTAEELAAMPPESAAGWWLAWALPADPGLLTEPVIHAPTPSTEAVGLPALLLGSFPVEPDRRRLADTAAARSLCVAAGELYADLITERAATGDLEDVAGLLPGGMPASHADSIVQDSASKALSSRRWLRRADGVMAAPDGVRLLDGAGSSLAEELAVRMPELLAPTPSVATRAALRRLGVAGVGLDEVIEAFPASTPGDAADLLTILSGESHDQSVVEAAALVPVPLLTPGGGVEWRRGARGLLLPGGSIGGADLAALGMATVHPDACVPGAAAILERLGAVLPDPARVLEMLGDSVGRGLADGDEAAFDRASEVRDAVLSVVAAAVESASAPEDSVAYVAHPWLAELPLPDADGVSTPAADLFVSGSAAESVNDLIDSYPLDDAAVRDYSTSVWEAVGVQCGPFCARAVDLASDSNGETGLDAVDEPTGEWLDDLEDRLGEPVYVPEVTTILGLEQVADWPAALTILDTDPALRAALTRRVPIMVRGDRRDVRGPAAAWIARHVDVDGLPLGQHAGEGTVPGRPAPEWVTELSADVRRAVLAADAADLDADGWRTVLGELDNAGIADCVPIWTALAESGVEIDPPPTAIAAGDPASARARAVDSGTVFVAEAPFWLTRRDLGSAVRVSWARTDLSDSLACALDVSLGSDMADQVLSAGHPAEYPPSIVEFCSATGMTELPNYYEHDDLRVDGQQVDWWVRGDDVHASTMFGMARAVAWQTGRWDRRDALFAIAAGEQTVADVLGELG